MKSSNKKLVHNVVTLDVYDNATDEYKGAIAIVYHRDGKKIVPIGNVTELIPEFEIQTR